MDDYTDVSKHYLGSHTKEFYEYTGLPQGFKHSPHIFNKVLKDDLIEIDQELKSTVVQYVDDIILYLSDEETRHKD